jgi:predicted lysophospholipase L1 biosynthesis ABC-type transport system permease subunit
MRLAETVDVNPVIPPAYDLFWTSAWVLTLAVALVLIAGFFLLLYGVVKNAVRNGMREHQVWLDSRGAVREEVSR